MIRIYYTVLVLIGTIVSASAQQDTTIITRSDGTIDTIISRDYAGHDGYDGHDGDDFEFSLTLGDGDRWGMLDLGVSILSPEENYQLENGLNPFEQRIAKSTNVNIHFYKYRLVGKGKSVGFDLGVSMEIFKYFFENSVVLRDEQPQLTIDYIENANFKKNRLTATYVKFPLMFNIRAPRSQPARAFHLAFGLDAGFLLGANFKTKTHDNDKVKTKDNYNLSPWRADLRAEIGLGPVVFYGSMGLNSVFDPDEDGGYNVTPYSLGIVLLPF